MFVNGHTILRNLNACSPLPVLNSNLNVEDEFTYPYLYQVSALDNVVIDELKSKLAISEIGQMFGVLIVQSKEGELGYLSGFSGMNLMHDCDNVQFVPRLISQHYEKELLVKYQQKKSLLQTEISALETSEKLSSLVSQLSNLKTQAAHEISIRRNAFINAKKRRKSLREQADEVNDVLLIRELNQQSVEQKKALKKLKLYWQQKISLIEYEIDFIFNKIRNLKEQCDKEHDTFTHHVNSKCVCLNVLKQERSLLELSDQCSIEDAKDEAVIKLLQYAFEAGLKPVSYAQFWWGPSPKQEVRHHGRIYPVSQTKTKAVLRHMLSGIKLQSDPLIKRLNAITRCEIVYADDDLIVINKPSDLLSVPGSDINNSVYSQVCKQFPEASGPVIVHRLDMATSGLMVVALNKQTHKDLQQQFIKRSVEKRYEALLDGVLENDEGIIKLPLRPDLLDRPRQVVCDQFGRYAETRWQVISRSASQTRVYFYPTTGRSHQLRMHAAHKEGLATPIVGDELYGLKSADRLHLHADLLGFVHPVTNKPMQFQLDADF